MGSLIRAVLMGLLMTIALSGCQQAAEGRDEAAILAAAAPITAFSESGAEWPARGGDYSERGFSPLTQIDTGNVGTLGLAWAADVDATRGLEATPIMVDGVIYITSTWSRVMAFDAVTGEELWAYDPEVPRDTVRKLCCDVVNRGVALWNGKVYFGTLDGRLISLDAKTGNPVWSVNTINDASIPYTITGAPRVVRGRVLIGNAGADIGVRGYLAAYDAETGEEDWRFWVVPQGPNAEPENEAMAAALKTWPQNDEWEGKGGGTPWDAMAYDPALDLIYLGTGNGGPWKRRHPEDRTDTLYVASIVALDAETGEMVWYYQTTPGEAWDYTATNSIILDDLVINGKMRQVLFQAPKNGFFYVLDRKTGELLSAEKYGAANWASHVDMATGRPVLTDKADFSKEDQLIYPNLNGAHDWQPMSYNPQTGLAYIPAFDVPWVYSLTRGFRYFYDIGVPPDALARMTRGQAKVRHGGALRAWDVASNTLKWEVPLSTTWNGGTLTTAGNLVFHASGDGYFSAYNAETGDRLLHLFTGNSAIAQPITYSINGVQYVAQLAGYGGSGMISVGDDAAVKVYENTGRLLVFKLGGGEVMTPGKRGKPIAPPVVDNSDLPDLTPAQIAKGKVLYGSCAGCHGAAGSTSILPNLENVRAIGEDGLKAILLDGALEANGMPKFTDRLSEEDVSLLHAFISRGYHNQPNAERWP